MSIVTEALLFGLMIGVAVGFLAATLWAYGV